MNFFKSIKNSIYSPVFYSQTRMRSFGSALGYFLLFILIIATVSSIPIIMSFINGGQKDISKIVNEAKNIYPSELEIKINQGKVSTNVKEPHFIPLTQEGAQAGEAGNLVVIDTTTPVSTTQFNKYNTIVWVTKDSIIAKSDDTNQIRTIDLSTAEDFTLNKSVVDSFIAQLSPWLNLIVPFAVFGIILGLFVVHSLKLIYFLIVAFLIWLLLKMMKKTHTYIDAYKISIYAATLGLLVETILALLNVKGFPFMFTLLTILVVVVNFKSVYIAPGKK